MRNLLQLKITLKETNPPIWRRVLVPSTLTFIDLHHIIQIVMGWQNAHLFEFYIGDNISIKIPDEEFGDIEGFNDARETTLELLTGNEVKKFEYEYDKGDSWRHEIEIEKIFSGGTANQKPLCVDGVGKKRASERVHENYQTTDGSYFDDHELLPTAEEKPTVFKGFALCEL